MTTRPDFGRILLAVDAAGIAPAALESLVRVAARLNAALDGLYVEDAEVRRVADLPFTTEIAAATGQEREFSAASVERANRALSSKVRTHLAALAGEQNVRWSFATAAGTRLQSALEAAHESDVLLLARGNRAALLHGHAPHRGERFRTVSFLYDASAESERALSVIHALRHDSLTREVIIVSATGAPTRVLRDLANSGLRTHSHATSERDPAALARELRRMHAGLLILPRRLFAARVPRRQAAALEATACSLMLLR